MRMQGRKYKRHVFGAKEETKEEESNSLSKSNYECESDKEIEEIGGSSNKEKEEETARDLPCDVNQMSIEELERYLEIA